MPCSEGKPARRSATTAQCSASQRNAKQRNAKAPQGRASQHKAARHKARPPQVGAAVRVTGWLIDYDGFIDKKEPA
jgi:hypothetical protein